MTKAVRLRCRGRRDPWGSTPRCSKYQQLIATPEVRVIFLQGYIATDGFSILQRTVLYSYKYEHHWLDPVSYREKKKTWSLEGDIWKGIWGKWRLYMTKTLCIYVWTSQRHLKKIWVTTQNRDVKTEKSSKDWQTRSILLLIPLQYFDWEDPGVQSTAGEINTCSKT